MSTYLEEYIESVSSLPADLQRNFRQMRELDKKSQELQRKLEEKIKVNPSKEVPGEVGKDATAVIGLDADEKTCVELADKKLALATKTYDLVDNHIRRLDKDLRKFEEDLKQERELLGGAVAEQKIDTPVGYDSRDEALKSGRKRSGRTVPLQAISNPNNLNVELDLPVDPSEPTYCYCNQVSYGEMVACDSPTCKIEWFHFGCVGIEDRPKGRWYCPDCRPNMQGRRRLK